MLIYIKSQSINRLALFLCLKIRVCTRVHVCLCVYTCKYFTMFAPVKFNKKNIKL